MCTARLALSRNVTLRSAVTSCPARSWQIKISPASTTTCGRQTNIRAGERKGVSVTACARFQDKQPQRREFRSRGLTLSFSASDSTTTCPLYCPSNMPSASNPTVIVTFVSGSSVPELGHADSQPPKIPPATEFSLKLSSADPTLLIVIYESKSACKRGFPRF